MQFFFCSLSVWMLHDESLLPLFQYGEPVPGTDLIRRGNELFPVGEHFDIDRRGRLYRPHQYVALAGEHEFTQAPIRDKLALPVCEAGPRHRFFAYCKNLHRSIDRIADLVRSDGNAGWTAVFAQQLEFERECLAQDEQDDPKKLVEAIATALGTRGMRPAMGFTTAPPPSPPPGAVVRTTRRSRGMLRSMRRHRVVRTQRTRKGQRRIMSHLRCGLVNRPLRTICKAKGAPLCVTSMRAARSKDDSLMLT